MRRYQTAPLPLRGAPAPLPPGLAAALATTAASPQPQMRMPATGQLPLPPVPQAPSYHQHTHDVHLLQTWIESAGTDDPLAIKKADVVAEGLIDYIMSRSKQHNEFFTELVRQTRVHCPKVATLLTRIWSGMFNLLDRATVNYERQFRAGQRLRGKMLRLLQHTKTKLDIYKNEVDRLKEHIEEKETELMDMRVKLQGLERQVASLETENEALNQRVVDAVKLGGKIQEAQQGHSIDWLASEFEVAFDGMDGERRRKIKFLADQERLVRHLEMELVLAAKSRVRIVRHHTGTQTEEEQDEGEMEIPPPAAPKKKVKGAHIPIRIRELMNSFPRKVRVLSTRGVRRLILQIYMDKVDNDQIHDEASHERLPMAQFIGEFMYHKYGLHTLTDYHLTELVLSVRSFHKEDARVRFFDLFIAAVAKHPGGGNRPVLEGAALDFVVDLFKRLRESKEVTKESIASDANAYIEINRTKAIQICREAFGFVAGPLVNSMLIRLESLPLPQSKDIRKVALDAFLAMMLEEWITEKERWENRLAPLFDKYSTMGNVLADRKQEEGGEESKGTEATGATPAAPEEAKGDDAVEEHETPFDSATISTSITPQVWDVIMKATAPGMDNRQLKLERTKRKRKLMKERIAREKRTNKLAGALNKSVAKMGRSLRVLTLGGFKNLMKEVEKEAYFEAKVENIFEDARAVFEQARWDRKRKPWKEAKDKDSGRRFVYHEETRQTAWNMPRLQRDKVVNMDYITFVEMCFRNNVLRDTANAEAVLDIETRAAIFIQRQFRHHMDVLKQRRRGKSGRPVSRPSMRRARSRHGDSSAAAAAPAAYAAPTATSSASSKPAASAAQSMQAAQKATGGQVRLADEEQASKEYAKITSGLHK